MISVDIFTESDVWRKTPGASVFEVILVAGAYSNHGPSGEAVRAVYHTDELPAEVAVTIGTLADGATGADGYAIIVGYRL